jgi:hypothetical protein
MQKIGLFVLLALIAIAPALSQDADCLSPIQAAVENALNVCTELEVNQVCYGSETVEVEPRPNIRLVFADPGDRVDLAAVESLTSYPLDAHDNTWGIAVLNVRGNFPDTGFSMVAFGEATVQNESAAPSDFSIVSVTISHPQGANVRETPSPDAPLVESLRPGETVVAVGRLIDYSWVRLRNGWVAGDLIRSDMDLSLLHVVAPDDVLVDDFYGPMQAFRFQTVVDDAPCSGASDSGVLVQAANDTALLMVNGQSIGFTGTLWLQTTEDHETVLNILEGTANYTEALWNAGDSILFSQQDDTLVFESQTDYPYTRARNLPLTLLPREIELPFSLGGVITPFEPGTGFLDTIPVDGACTVAWSSDVNLRDGPGREYPIRQGVFGGYYALPDARAQGTDGALWWRLAEGTWVAADNTAAAGACGTLPLVDPPALIQPG